MPNPGTAIAIMDAVPQIYRMRAFLTRLPPVLLLAEPRRIYSSFIKGYETLPVRIPG